jgi:hypothetical protein
MAIHPKIEYAKISEFRLDPKNPRLGRGNTSSKLTQDQILSLMEDWTLDELATSFLESGFWPQEALMVVEEALPSEKKPALIVVEGNRRLAALLYLLKARAGTINSPRWKELIQGSTEEAFKKLEEIPYVKADSRDDVQAYLGFRHVTGIKEWAPAEKAEYIAHLIDDKKMSYDEVRRKIGSKTPTVRQNYISYRLLLQMENVEDISLENVEEKFSVLFLSLRSNGTQQFLDIDIEAPPNKARTPVPKEKLDNLRKFALWLFGNEEKEPIVTDSRAVDKFGEVLSSPVAVDYLKRQERPNLETAFRLAGGDESQTTLLIERAADNIEEALRTVHHHIKSPALSKAVKRLGLDALELLGKFPALKEELLSTKEH